MAKNKTADELVRDLPGRWERREGYILALCNGINGAEMVDGKNLAERIFNAADRLLELTEYGE